MTDPVAAPGPPTAPRLVLPVAAPGVLVHESVVGAGVSVGVDLMAPDAWSSVSCTAVTAANTSVLRALAGTAAVRVLDAPTDRPPPVDGSRAAPWVRIAVVDALDRWLQLPLDQSLVDAERGVSRRRAAHTLPDGDAARRAVVGEGLELARAGAGGVKRYLRRLGAHRRAVPSGLLAALRRLVEGYAELVDEVHGADRELTSVLAAWQALTSAVVVDGHPPARRRSPLPRLGGAGRSMIDPRQVRSRVLALAADPGAGEVTLCDTRVDGERAVVVRVPAFRRILDQHVVPRLLVRLVDQTAAARGESVLTLARSDQRRPPYFEGVVPLHGRPSGDLRADVFDVLSDLPPAPTDADEHLHEVRRATVFLSEWRRLAALAQLPAVEPAPARLLRELARRLSGGHADPDRPLFTGGPAPADLRGLGDAQITDVLRGRTPDPSGGRLPAVVGAGGLLVAELAAILS